ncbi:hypothetical protein [Microtetraspora malaysiensis]|uniref:hypothetical protein n=1 Tax=Microtetraspora malaysiensis TaxID=161358 RepID=UPI00082C366A|nr:hypothetical protein [Microtetraspora malaysiensis]
MSSRLAVIAVSLVSAVIIALSAVAIMFVLNPESAPPALPEAGRDRSDGPNLVMEERSPPAVGQEPALGQEPSVGQGAAAGQDAAEERTEAGVRQAAQTTLDFYSSGAYGQFWDSWTADAQKLIARDDYLRMFELCKPIAEDLRFEIKGVTLDGDGADVQVTHFLAAFTYRFRYEGGRWRYIPEQQAQADYTSKTVDQMAAERRASRGCAD